MSFYETNFECLKKYRPYLVDTVEKAQSDKVKIAYTNDMPNLIVNENMVYLPTAKDCYDKVEIPKGKKNMFIIGCGLGFWWEKMRTTGNKPQSLILIEKEPAIFKAWLTVTDATDILKNPAATIIVGAPVTESAYEMIQQAIASNHANILKHILLSGFMEDACAAVDKESREYYTNILNFCVQGSEQSLADFGNDIEDSFFGLENLLMSVKRMATLQGFKEWRGIAKGIPGIVVGAGPSLDKNKALLAQWKGKAVIGSCDTALPLLLKDGIVPDFVSSIERTPTTIKYYEGLQDNPHIKDIVFAPAAVIKPEIYKLCTDQYKMPTIAVFRDFKHFEWVPFERGIIRSGKSATHLIFKMLVEMGCNPIILVGQDCAFAEDDATHAQGADHSSQGMRKSGKYKQQMQVMGNYGKMLKTLRVWYDFKRTFEKYVIQHPDIKVINCTEGGAVIEGTQFMKLEQALSEHGYLQSPKLPVAYPTDESIVKDLAAIEKRKAETIQYLDALIKDCDMLSEADDAAAIGQTLNAMLNHPMFSLIIMHLAQSYLFWWTNTIARLGAERAGNDKIMPVMKEFIEALRRVAENAKDRFEVLI